MDTNNIEQKLAALEVKIDATYSAVEKMRKYMLIVAWVTIAMVVLPALGLIFVIPMFINSYAGALGGL
jgi:hypothetical protein